MRTRYEEMMWASKNIKHFDRVAIVGNRKWEELLIKVDSLVFGEKYFDITKLNKAWEYIEGGAKK